MLFTFSDFQKFNKLAAALTHLGLIPIAMCICFSATANDESTPSSEVYVGVDIDADAIKDLEKKKALNLENSESSTENIGAQETEAIPEEKIVEASLVDPAKERCENFLVSQDIEMRFNRLRNRLEKDFTEGTPNKLKSRLELVRKQVDKLSKNYFNLDRATPSEIKIAVNQLVAALTDMIEVLPQAASLAPDMRSRYVIPFTNISSLKAEHQDCLMEAAVAQAQAEISAEKEGDFKNEVEPESSANIYKRLTSEMSQLNKNLYDLETADIDKFVNYRQQLQQQIIAFNKGEIPADQLIQKMPEVINTVHMDIEKLLPGLQLSKKFYTAKH